MPERFTHLLSPEPNGKRKWLLESGVRARSGENADLGVGPGGGGLLVLGIVVRGFVFEAAGYAAAGRVGGILFLAAEFCGEYSVQGRIGPRREDLTHEVDGFDWSDLHAALPLRTFSGMIGRMVHDLRGKSKAAAQTVD